MQRMYRLQIPSKNKVSLVTMSKKNATIVRYHKLLFLKKVLQRMLSYVKVNMHVPTVLHHESLSGKVHVVYGKMKKNQAYYLKRIFITSQ